MKKNLLALFLSLIFLPHFCSAESFDAKGAEAPSISSINSQPSSLPAEDSTVPEPVSLNLASAETVGPAQVIIIRHGEKPPVGNHLNDQGRARAQALVEFFKNNPEVTQYGTPAAIYAMRPSPNDGSFRPIETVTPLADSLGLPINENYAKRDGDAMAQSIKTSLDYAGKMVLICWEHHDIPNLVRSFGWDSAPDSWKGDVFDRAWVLNFENGKPTSFKDVPEHVLPGDSSN